MMTTPSAGVGPAQPQPSTAAPPAPARREHALRLTRLGGAWAGLAIDAVVLIILLIFILENSRQASIGYCGLRSLPASDPPSWWADAGLP